MQIIQAPLVKGERATKWRGDSAFNKRLKTDVLYRFYVLAFAVALGIRLEKRYGTFFRRLFRLFAYIRERNALKTLKKVLGFHGDTDIREMIEVETEKIIILFSQQQNQWSTGGGKRVEFGDIAIEEELNAFFKECTQEEQKTVENNLGSEKAERVDARDESLPTKADDIQREKIYVEELGNGEQVVAQKKKTNTQTKIEQLEKPTSQSSETDIPKNEKTEKTVEKTVANTSIFVEMMVFAEERAEEVPSPFPIFRENSENKVVAEKNDSISITEAEPKLEKTSGDHLDKNARIDFGEERTPFPVFYGEKRTIEKAVRQEEKTTKSIIETKAEKTIQEYVDENEDYAFNGKTAQIQPQISEENKARIELNTSMRKDEILAIVTQLKDSANIEMERVEKEWREQVSIEQGSREMKPSVKATALSSDKGETLGFKK